MKVAMEKRRDQEGSFWSLLGPIAGLRDGPSARLLLCLLLMLSKGKAASQIWFEFMFDLCGVICNS